MWLHKTRPIAFSLIVDDFAVKYVGKQHAYHLNDALLRSYELTTDWEGKVYSGIFEMGLQNQDMWHFHAWLRS
jgi:hypothetical protein